MTLIVTICTAVLCEVHRLPAPSLLACLTGGQAEIAAAIGPLLTPTRRVTRIQCEGRR